MASEQKMTEYERRRLENIKRNSEMLAALNVQARLSDLSASSKRQRVEEKSYKSSEKKEKQKPDAPIVIRRSLRTQGKAPDLKGLPEVINVTKSDASNRKNGNLAYSLQPHPVVEEPLSMKDAFDGDGSYRAIVDKFRKLLKKSELGSAYGEQKRITRSHGNGGFSSTSEVKKEKFEETRDFKLNSRNSKKPDLQADNVQATRPRTRSRVNGISKSPVKIERVKLEESIDLKPVKVDSEKVAKSDVEEEDGEGKHWTTSHVNGVSSSPAEFRKVKLDVPIDLKSFKLESENIARLVPGRIFTVRFVPTTDMTMVVAGNKVGHVSFWDVKPQNENTEDDVIHLYQPHTAPVSGFAMHPFSLSKMYSSSYDGFLRLMNIEREQFDLAYSSSTGSALFSLCQQPNDPHSLYFGEGKGDLNMFDTRVGEVTKLWSLHDHRINTIDFNPANLNIMATSSTDGFAYIWDLRKMDVEHPSSTALHSVNHGRTVYSAYFSPSGINLATTSADNNIGLLYGPNFEDKFMIPHENWVNRWVSPFRATWGWDDTHLFVGNMKRCVDVISADQIKTVCTLESPLMTAIPCRYDAHPFMVGMLAGATSGGQVYVWTVT